MAVTTFTLKVNAKLITGVVPRNTHLLLRTNFNGAVNFAGADGTYVPGGWRPVPGGIGEFDLPHTNIVGANPADYRHWAFLKVELDGDDSKVLGPYEVDAPVGTTEVWLNDCGPATNVPADWRDEFRDEVLGIKADAVSEVTTIRDEVAGYVIGELGTTDSQAATLISTPGTLTGTALNDAIGEVGAPGHDANSEIWLQSTRTLNALGVVDAQPATPWANTPRTPLTERITLIDGSADESAGIARVGFAAQEVDTVNHKVGGRAWKLTSTGATANPTVTFTLPGAPVAIVPAQTLAVWAYIPDASNVTNVVATLHQDVTGGPTLQRGARSGGDPVQQTIRSGWNLFRFGLAFAIGSSNTWTGAQVSKVTLRFDIPAGATNTWTIAHAWLETPAKAKMIWTLDRGYRSFILNGGLARCRALGIPITWAVDPLVMGTYPGGGGESITMAEVAAYAEEGDSVSWHGWTAEATAAMTAAQSFADSWEALKYLKRGEWPGRMWRAAWVQNNSGGHSGLTAPLVLGQASGLPGLTEASVVDSWPPSDMNNIFRWAIYGTPGAAAFVDRVFSRLKRTRGFINPYTHGILGGPGSTGAAVGVPGNDSTLAEMDYFFDKVEEAMAEGWLEATTFEALWAASGGTYTQVGSGMVATWTDEDGLTRRKLVL